MLAVRPHERGVSQFLKGSVDLSKAVCRPLPCARLAEPSSHGSEISRRRAGNPKAKRHGSEFVRRKLALARVGRGFRKLDRLSIHPGIKPSIDIAVRDISTVCDIRFGDRQHRRFGCEASLTLLCRLVGRVQPMFLPEFNPGHVQAPAASSRKMVACFRKTMMPARQLSPARASWGVILDFTCALNMTREGKPHRRLATSFSRQLSAR